MRGCPTVPKRFNKGEICLDTKSDDVRDFFRVSFLQILLVTHKRHFIADKSYDSRMRGVRELKTTSFPRFGEKHA